MSTTLHPSTGLRVSSQTPTPQGNQLAFLVFTLLVLLGMVAVGVSFARM